MVYEDKGYGITEKSLKLWHQHKGDIGKIWLVRARSETPEMPDGYTLIIYGSKGEIKLSGCNCGYGGTGPNGTRKILEELGMNSEDAYAHMFMKEFDWNL